MKESRINKNTKGGMQRSLLQLLLYVLIIGLLNTIASFLFSRIDLTSDKRYTLSPATQKMLAQLNDVVYFKIYLEGNLPAGFDRLKTSAQEMLDEMRVYSNGNIEYQLINPSENPDKKKQNELSKQLIEKGIFPTYIEAKVESGTTQQVIFPAMLASYQSKEFPVQLFKEQVGIASDVQLNNSIQSLEYEIASALKVLTTQHKLQIAFTQGHGELDSIEVADIHHELSHYYTVNRIKINTGNIQRINRQTALIIAKPDSLFTEQEKYILDQYIMQGGKVLWLLEGLSASMDSLTKAPQTYGIAQSIHLDNQLFKYGVRVNNNLVMDMRSGVIPIPINNKYSLAPWPYLPLLSQRTNHPISNNINLVKGEFTSSIDTIQTAGIKKTVLLASSRYAHVQNAPAPIDLRIAYQPLSERFFTQAYNTTAILLEGEFESLYKNHLLPELQSIAQIKFNEKSSATKMIVVADGDIIKNAVQYSAGKAYPLGYDVYSKQTYGNKNFILNCMNYLCDDSGLIEVRSRELKLRMLDRKKVNAEKMKWQSINTILPIGILILLGLLQAFIRKRKYSL